MMNMTRRSFLKGMAVGGAAFGSAGILSACGSSASSSSDSGSTSASEETKTDETVQDAAAEETADTSLYEVTEPISIEFWHSIEDEFVDPVVEAFNASQDMITVEAVHVGGYSAIKEQVAAAQAAGTGLPGLCVINYPQLLTYAESGVAEPLDAYMEADGYENYFYEGFTDPLTMDGQLYAFPYGPSTTVIYYNKDLVTESGLTEYPQTWEELKSWAVEFHEATGKIAFSFPGNSSNYINSFLINTGVDPLGDGTTCLMDDEAIVRWIKEVKELVDCGAMDWVNTGSSSETDIKTEFLAGESCALAWTSTYYDKVLPTADFEVGIALVPLDATNNSTVSGATLFIPVLNDQQVKNAAYQFLTYLTNDENAKEFALNTAYLPTKTSLLDSEEEIAEFCELYPAMRTVYENMDTIISKNPSPYFEKALTQICEDLTMIFNAGEDLDKTVASMVDEVNYILSGN